MTKEQTAELRRMLRLKKLEKAVRAHIKHIDGLAPDCERNRILGLAYVNASGEKVRELVGMQTYEAWLEANDDELTIADAESGADRESGYSCNDTRESQYCEYLEQAKP